MYYNDCPKELKDFLFYIETIQGSSPNTVNGYYIDLKSFYRYIKLSSQHLPKKEFEKQLAEFESVDIYDVGLDVLKELTLSDIYEYLYFLSHERNNSPVTRSRKISSLRAFFNYLHTKVKLIDNNPTKELTLPNTKKSMPKYLNLEQAKDLLKAAFSLGEREYCMVTLFLNCGMRLSELVGLNLSDVKTDSVKILGKGNKERIVYLNAACVEALELYLPIRTKQINVVDKEALFLSSRGTRISARRVQQLVDKALQISGLANEGYSTHKLRHTAATLMYQHNNTDIRVLQEILGHVNLATTEIYTHVANKQVEDALKSSPLSNVKLTAKETKDIEKDKK